MPYGDEAFEIDLDFVALEVSIRAAAGNRGLIQLVRMSASEFDGSVWRRCKHSRSVSTYRGLLRPSVNAARRGNVHRPSIGVGASYGSALHEFMLPYDELLALSQRAERRLLEFLQIDFSRWQPFWGRGIALRSKCPRKCYARSMRRDE